MVKGVNKTVIEVNDTGSKMFEKIVFYVSPQYGNMSPANLSRAADDAVRNLNIPVCSSLRQRVKRKQRMRLFLTLSCLLIVAVIVLIAIL